MTRGASATVGYVVAALTLTISVIAVIFAVVR